MTDATQEQKAVQRPLSPHLQIYKPQFTSVTSILNRITGVALAMGLFVIAWGLIALATGEEAFAVFQNLASSVFGHIVLFGWTMAFFYHMCGGIRHLIMDTGAMMDLKGAYKSACFVYAGTVILTLIVWGLYFYCGAQHGAEM
jgi:succinate dehydrogenase / fumarate reductase cytochrome b subunit